MEKTRTILKKSNYLFLLLGLVIIFTGFILMGLHSNVENENLMYAFSKITLAPVLIISGYAVMFVSIFKK